MKLIKRIILLLFILTMIYPFVFILIGMTHDAGWAFKANIDYRFGNQLTYNFKYITSNFSLFRIIFNSIMISVSTATLSIISIFLAAYAFNKYKFMFKRVLFVIFTVSIFIPQAGILVGSLKAISYLGLYGTLLGLIIPFIVNIRIFVYLYQICSYIPNEIMEAARIDGSSEFNLLMNISIPSVQDKLIFSFFMLLSSSWNNFLIPMIMTTKSENYTLPVLISSLADPLSYNIGSTFLVLSISIFPLIIMFLFLSKKIFITDY